MPKRTDRPGLIERRAFMTSGAIAALLALLPKPLKLAPAAAPSHPIGGALWSDPESACAVGRRYLTQTPEEANLGHLVKCLFGSDKGRCGLTPESLLQQIAERRDHDFASGDTVLVDGWILARTEARICALTALGMGRELLS